MGLRAGLTSNGVDNSPACGGAMASHSTNSAGRGKGGRDTTTAAMERCGATPRLLR